MGSHGCLELQFHGMLLLLLDILAPAFTSSYTHTDTHTYTCNLSMINAKNEALFNSNNLIYSNVTKEASYIKWLCGHAGNAKLL